MLASSGTYPLVALNSAARYCLYTTSSPVLLNVYSSKCAPTRMVYGHWTSVTVSHKWELNLAAQSAKITFSDEEQRTWEACKQALSAFQFKPGEVDKILGKSFGLINSPYWGEEREKKIPKFESVHEILDYLRSLSLSDDDLCKVLKKFPEVLGCSLEEELKVNVLILEKEWGIKGKSLRNLLLRNPKVLGYNVDCKGDCMAKCTRCWVRF